MTTEYEKNFVKHEPFKIDTNVMKVGPKEDSGFVTNKEKEDVITFAPGERWNSRARTTGFSTYQDKFKSYSFAKVKIIK